MEALKEEIVALQTALGVGSESSTSAGSDGGGEEDGAGASAGAGGGSAAQHDDYDLYGDIDTQFESAATSKVLLLNAPAPVPSNHLMTPLLCCPSTAAAGPH